MKGDYIIYFCLSFRANGEMKPDASEDESEEENEEGDYTVYECPGLAPVRTVCGVGGWREGGWGWGEHQSWDNELREYTPRTEYF